MFRYLNEVVPNVSNIKKSQGLKNLLLSLKLPHFKNMFFQPGFPLRKNLAKKISTESKREISHIIFCIFLKLLKSFDNTNEWEKENNSKNAAE